MNVVRNPSSSLRPKWDGARILFDIHDGDTEVQCAISRGAIEEISERRCFRTDDLMACFAGARARIEALALEKARGRPAGSSGRVNLWADDVEFVPPSEAGAARQAAATRQIP